MKLPIWHHGKIYAHALVDDEDFEHLNQYKWGASIRPHGKLHRVYALASVGTKEQRQIFSLHRFIMNAPADMVVDHINRDTLDNRKVNLRVCTQKENSANPRR